MSVMSAKWIVVYDSGDGRIVAHGSPENIDVGEWERNGFVCVEMNVSELPADFSASRYRYVNGEFVVVEEDV